MDLIITQVYLLNFFNCVILSCSNAFKSQILVPVPIYCPNSCNLCKTVSACSDSQSACETWANLGLCTTVNSKDPNLCKRSCGLCGNLTK